jgi:hypothetical protein
MNVTGTEVTPTADRPELRRQGERMERLLDELRGMVGPPAWARVEELLRLVFELEGAALERLLDHALAAGADLKELERRASGDEVVSSLLLLHGLHPVPAAERVERALAAVQDGLGLAAGALSVVALGHDGVARVRLDAAGCPSARPSLVQAVRRAVLDAAPELAGVEVEGGDPAPAGRLVTIGLPPERR